MTGEHKQYKFVLNRLESLERAVFKLEREKTALLHVVTYLMTTTPEGRCPACLAGSKDKDHEEDCWIGLTLQDVRR